MDPEARQRQLLGADQAPDPRPERARAGRQPVRGPALARPGERGVPGQPGRGRPGDAQPHRPQLPARVPRPVDVEVLLPPDRPRPARPRGDRGDAAATCSAPTPRSTGCRSWSASGPPGNPFFIEEVVQSLVEAGNLEGERGAYRLARPVEDAAVPASVQAVLVGAHRPARAAGEGGAPGGGGDRQGVPRAGADAGRRAWSPRSSRRRFASWSRASSSTSRSSTPRRSTRSSTR